MGRPRIPIDFKQFDLLCSILCTQEEIAAFFGCTIDTIENRVKEEKGVTFSEYYRQKSAAGKRSLRRKQYEIAQRGNVVMLIWLGKQWLGQRDVTQMEHSGGVKILRDSIPSTEKHASDDAKR